MSGPRVDSTSYFLDLESIRCQSSQLDTANFGSKSFDVSPSTHALTIAYQDGRLDDTVYSTSILNFTQAKSALAMERFYVDYVDNVGAPFSFEWMVRFTCKLQGAAASFYSSSKFFYSTGTSVNASLRGWLQNTSSIQNTTIQNILDVRGQWSSNQVENNITINSLCVSKCY